MIILLYMESDNTRSQTEILLRAFKFEIRGLRKVLHGGSLATRAKKANLAYLIDAHQFSSQEGPHIGP